MNIKIPSNGQQIGHKFHTSPSEATNTTMTWVFSGDAFRVVVLLCLTSYSESWNLSVSSREVLIYDDDALRLLLVRLTAHQTNVPKTWRRVSVVPLSARHRVAILHGTWLSLFHFYHWWMSGFPLLNYLEEIWQIWTRLWWCVRRAVSSSPEGALNLSQQQCCRCYQCWHSVWIVANRLADY